MISNTLPPSLVENPNIDQWLAFPPDGTVTLRTGKVEIGQGLLTALIQIAAEELDVELPRINLMTASTDAAPNEGYTAGSRSIEQAGVSIRLVCAEVRKLFRDAAADRLGCDPAALQVVDGTFTLGTAPTGFDYWRLSDAVDLKRRASGTVPAKDPAQHRIIGTDVPRIDLPEKVGRTPFIHDVVVPDMGHANMLHAKLLHRPRRDAKLVEWDEAAVSRAGLGQVSFLTDGDVVAVMGDDEHLVARAFDKLCERARWEGGFDLREEHQEASSLMDFEMAPDRVVERGARGDVPVVHEIEGTYSRPYIAHGSIAPSCGLALFQDGKLTVWSHSQGIFFLRRSIALALKLPIEAVIVTHHQGAGCYGHNGADDAAFDAALVAMRNPGRVVRVQWTRADELGVAPVGAASLVRFRAGLDADFRPVDWQFDVWSPTHGNRPGMYGAVNLLTANALSDPPNDPPPACVADEGGGGATRNGVTLYDLPYQKLVHHFVRQGPVRTSSMRGLGAFANVFAMESFIDEIAELGGMDPVTYRLMIMKDPRARGVIEAAAKMCDWFNEDAVAPGATRGFAFSRYKNVAAYLAMAVEVVVEEEVRVTRAWCAVDGGLVVNPDGARNQVDGGVIQAISWALKEQVKFAQGKVASDRWEHYPILRFSEVPEIETIFVGDPHDPPLGIGEVSAGPTAAAIGNAVAKALGMRLRHLPLTRERIMQAMLEA